MDGATSAWDADECNRVSGQELSPEAEKMPRGLVHDGELRELEAWKKFDVNTRRSARSVSKKIAETRRVLTRKAVDEKRPVKARLVAKGSQGPCLQEGFAGTSGCVSPRSSHLQVISLSATKMEISGSCE